MSLDNRPDNAPEIQSVDDLVETLREAEKPRAAFRLGMEHEKIGLLEDSLAPLPYSGRRSIEAVFQMLVERLGFEPYREGDDVIALVKAGTNISLEPGGQFELSGAVLSDNHDVCAELTEHRDVTRRLGEELGIVWLGVGHHPFATREQVEWVPKERYRIMRGYLPTRGARALDMMLRTGTVQANFDYADEADMAVMMRTAMAITPIVSAVYANSSIVEGRVSDHVSVRQRIWQEVDPDRAGLLDFVFRPDFGYRDYVEWALDVPMFFIRRGGRYVPGIAGTPFRTFLERGFEGHRALLSDWQDHLTTLFPEVRLKGYIEVRGADCCSRALNCALPALWKGILYDPGTRAAAFELAADWTFDERRTLLHEVARYGLQAEVRGRPVLELAKELLDISRRGLTGQHRLDRRGRDETRFLEPVEEVLYEEGVSPGRTAAELWEGEFGRDPRRLVEYYRF